MNSNPKVSILCITYNHELFIRQALESFIMQKVKFSFEVIIGEDCSTDKTAEIIREFEHKYPDIFKVVYQKKNVGAIKNFIDVLQKASGEYVALCEGDDYFIDPYKIQKQVDFLDANREFSICFHPVKVIYEDNSKPEKIFPSFEYRFEKNILELDDLMERNFIQTNSVMYRWRFGKEDVKNIFPGDIIPGDWFLHLLHAQQGKIGFMNEIMSVYRRHKDGIWWESGRNMDYLHLKHGIEEMNFYKNVHRVFVNNSKEYLEERILPFAWQLINLYLRHGKFEELEKFLEFHKEYYKLVIQHVKYEDGEFEQKNQESRKLKEELHEIRSSLRWKVPNYFYKFYYKKIKKYIPKSIFFLANKGINACKKLGRLVKKYAQLSRMAYQEYEISGFLGLSFAVKRHLKKRKGQLLVSYPTVNDYENNLVSIIILSKNKLNLIRPCIESIEKNLSGKYNVEILIGDTGSTEKQVWKYYRKVRKKYKNIRISKFKQYFFSKNCNDICRIAARGEYVLFLNNDTIVKSQWLDNLVGPLKEKKIGVVGGKLLYKDNTIQHAGIEADEQGHFVHVYVKEREGFSEANYAAIVPAVTFACVAMRHDVFDRFKLDEQFKEEAQDTDLCMRLREAGFNILYNPCAEVYHFECSTRDWRKGEPDRILFLEKWKNEIIKLNSKLQRIPYEADEYEDAIVVIRDDGIGDLLMGVSAFTNLRKRYPNKKLVLLTYERNMEMMDGFKIFNEILPIPNGKKYSPLPIPTNGTTVYNFIDLEMHFGNEFAKTKEDNKKNRHDVYTRDMQLDPKFELVPMPEYAQAKENVVAALREIGFDENEKFVAINLFASNPARSWWEPYYEPLIAAIEEMGFVPLIIGTKDSVYFKGKRVANLVGKTKTIAEYAEAIKLGKYVISTDTSAYHIAALSGIPFLAIFTGGVLIDSRLGYYDKYEATEPKELPCYPCWDEGCKDLSIRHKKDPCRLAIKPEVVVKKFKTLTQKYPAR